MTLANANDFLRYMGISDPMLVAAGKVSGVSFIAKFGASGDVDTDTVPQDVWSGAPETYSADGGVYTFSSSADIDSISSSSDTDTQDVTIDGLDSSYELVTQTITLTGQTRKALDTSLIRVFRAYNTNSADFDGEVYIYKNGATTDGVPDTLTDIRAKIIEGTNQTEMAIYTIPAGKTGFFIQGYVGVSKITTSEAEFVYYVRPFGGVFQIKGRIAQSTIGNGYWIYKYGIPLAVPEKADVKITCVNVGANGTGVVGGFDILLVDNEVLDKIPTLEI